MQTYIYYGVKFTNEEMKEYCKLKNIDWVEDIEIDLIFNNIPEEIIWDKNITIFGFKIVEEKESLFELEKLTITNFIKEKINLFIKENNIKKNPTFFVMFSDY